MTCKQDVMSATCLHCAIASVQLSAPVDAFSLFAFVGRLQLLASCPNKEAYHGIWSLLFTEGPNK